MTRSLRFAPLAVLLLLVCALLWRVTHPQNPVVRSRIVGQPVPVFALPAAAPSKPGLASADLADGKPHLLNLFASWCVPCVAEAPVLAQLARRGAVIHGIAIRDRPEDVAHFLARHGDPYRHIGSDHDSRVQLALGSSGVPETFVLDGRGRIRFQHIGPIAAGDVPVILAHLKAAQ